MTEFETPLFLASGFAALNALLLLGTSAAFPLLYAVGIIAFCMIVLRKFGFFEQEIDEIVEAA